MFLLRIYFKYDKMYKIYEIWRIDMINTFAFLTLLLLFVRIYSFVSLLFLSGKQVQFAERITVLILLFEVLIIFLYTFFASFRYLLPPVLMLLE